MVPRPTHQAVCACPALGCADIIAVVTLIAAADLLGNAANSASQSLANPILFMMFHGVCGFVDVLSSITAEQEAFGYIGSSRFAYNLRKNAFPSKSAPV
jgi:hypothetical protein